MRLGLYGFVVTAVIENGDGGLLVGGGDEARSKLGA